MGRVLAALSAAFCLIFIDLKRCPAAARSIGSSTGLIWPHGRALSAVNSSTPGGASTCKRHEDCRSGLCIHVSATMPGAYNFAAGSGVCADCAEDADCPKGQSCWQGRRPPSYPGVIVPTCGRPCKAEEGASCWCKGGGVVGASNATVTPSRGCPNGWFCQVGDVPGSTVTMALLGDGQSLKFGRAPVQQCMNVRPMGSICLQLLGRWVAPPGSCNGPGGQEGLCENVGLVDEESDNSSQSGCTHACASDADCKEGAKGGVKSGALGVCDTDKLFYKAKSMCILTSVADSDSKVHIPGVACNSSALCGGVGTTFLAMTCVAHPKWNTTSSSKQPPKYGVCAASCSKVGERCTKVDAAGGVIEDPAILSGPFYPLGSDSFTVCAEQQQVGIAGKTLVCLPQKKG